MNNLKKDYLEKFQKSFDFLNDEQKEAVETIDGPVVVVAGPGTGKTQILTLRIANIIKELGAEFAPNILALTFTNAGVYAMRKRLASFIGTELAYQVGIFTFHSFADEQIRTNPEVFKKFAFSKAISDIERIEIIEEILNKGKWDALQTFASDFHYTQNIIEAINDLKSEAISPEDFEKTFNKIEERILNKEGDGAFYQKKYGKYKAGDMKPLIKKKIEKEKIKQKELLEIYKKYQEKLSKKHLYDFSDMVLSVVQEAKRSNEFKTSLQEKYMYLLIDEHQDTNDAQNKMIELIASADVNEGSPNIFTVGDEKQAIYRFQGASLESFSLFREKYDDVKIINLKNNYRSSQNILDGAFSLLGGKVKLIAQNENFSNIKEKIKIIKSADRKSEIIFLAETVKEKINQGVDMNEIAVFYKENKEVEIIKDVFEKYKIPYKVNSKENILENKEIKKLIILLDAIENPYDDEKISKALFINFLNFDVHDILKILKKMSLRKGEKIKNKSILKLISSENILESIDVSEPKKFIDFSLFLKEMKRDEVDFDFLEFFEKLINKSGFLKHILELKNNVSGLKMLEKIFDEVRKQVEIKKKYSLKDFLNYIDILKKYNLKIEVGKNDLEDGVNLMTAHGSKGLEFEYVYITNFINSKWGKSRKRPSSFVLPISKPSGDIDDERRLFYVALTRGKKEVNILYSSINDNGKEVEPSVFLEEIGEEFFENIKVDNKSLEEKTKILFSEKEEKILSIFDKEYIKKLFLENTLSVSALNNYFSSPIKYFFRNLVRIPSAQAKPLIFGNIIHDTLDVYFKKGKMEKITPSKKELLEIFDNSIKKFSIPEKYFDDIYKQGQKVLEKYFDRYSEEFNFNVETEKKIFAEMKLNSGDILKLYGIIDKTEMIDNGKIRVVDYKTGKTFAEKNKDQKSDLERQLVFYKLLIDKFYNADRVDDGVLDFVEKSKKTEEFVKERRTIFDRDVEKLKLEIEEFADDILTGKFLERKYEKDKNNEEYFELWELLRK